MPPKWRMSLHLSSPRDYSRVSLVSVSAKRPGLSSGGVPAQGVPVPRAMAGDGGRWRDGCRCRTRAGFPLGRWREKQLCVWAQACGKQELEWLGRVATELSQSVREARQQVPGVVEEVSGVWGGLGLRDSSLSVCWACTTLWFNRVTHLCNKKA